MKEPNSHKLYEISESLNKCIKLCRFNTGFLDLSGPSRSIEQKKVSYNELTTNLDELIECLKLIKPGIDNFIESEIVPFKTGMDKKAKEQNLV